MPRLFFALQPEPAQRDRIGAAALLQLHSVGGTAVAATDLHLTLCFLGEVATSQLPALAQAAADLAPLQLGLLLTQVDWWQGPRVLCLLPPAGDGLDALAAFAARLHHAVASAGVEPDQRPFRPHVTIVRRTPAAAARARRWPAPLGTPLPITSDGFVLMQNTGARSGPRYEAIRRWPSTSATRMPPARP